MIHVIQIDINPLPMDLNSVAIAVLIPVPMNHSCIHKTPIMKQQKSVPRWTDYTLCASNVAGLRVRCLQYYQLVQMHANRP